MGMYGDMPMSVMTMIHQDAVNPNAIPLCMAINRLSNFNSCRI